MRLFTVRAKFWLRKVEKNMLSGSFAIHSRKFMQKKTFKSVTLWIQEEQFEMVYALVSDRSGYLGSEEGFDQIKVFFDDEKFSEPDLDLFIGELSDLLDSEIEFTEETVEERNWNEEWESTIQPVIIDDYFCIYPSWNKPEHKYPVEIEVDPKMSFGTGYHETTRLMMQSLRKLPVQNAALLDCGTGTGVLAIAAVLLGAENVFAFDIDEWSFDNCVENASNNRVSDKIKFALGGYETIPASDEYDIVLANVNKNVHSDFGTYYQKHVKSGGYLVLSGLLKYDEEQIQGIFTKMNFKHKFTLSENEWICIGFTK